MGGQQKTRQQAERQKYVFGLHFGGLYQSAIYYAGYEYEYPV
jgi:hypothetical protein